MVIAILMIFSALITAVSQILLKQSANKKYDNIIFEYLNPYVIISYGMFAAVLILNVFIFTKIDYRYGIVLNSLPTVMVMVLSNLLLKEKISRRRIIGNIIIIAGISIFML